MTHEKAHFHNSLSGYYSLRATRPDGSYRETGWFPNIITNGGLNQMGTSSAYLSNCYVGAGSATPNENDSALAGFLAANSSRSSNNGAQSAPPYYAWITNTYRFNAGVAQGNLSEVGVGNSQNALYSRALILDGSGNPATFPVQSDEFLDVAYQLRFYPPTTDVSGQIDLDGNTYDWLGRASSVTSAGQWGFASATGESAAALSGTIDIQIYNGDIGSITGSPSGTSSNRTSFSNASYSSGSLQRSATGTWGLSDGNIGGVSAMRIRFGWCRYQFAFDPPIPKDNTKILQLTVTHSWGRRAS